MVSKTNMCDPLIRFIFDKKTLYLSGIYTILANRSVIL